MYHRHFLQGLISRDFNNT